MTTKTERCSDILHILIFRKDMVYKVTFDTEPMDYEIYDFVLKNYYQLQFSLAVVTDVKEIGRNPKRVQCEVRKQVQSTRIGTKS